MSKHVVRVTQWIEVEMDEAKFDAAFMEEFTSHFYPYDTIPEHAQHLAQMFARGVADNGDFIEGYGPAKEMGIAFRHVDGEKEYEGRDV